MSRQSGAHDSNPLDTGQGGRPRVDPKYSTVLLPAVMAAAMSLVDTIVSFGLTPDLLTAWLGSFAVGVVVAAPTAILIAPAAQRLVGRLTGGQRADRAAVRCPNRPNPCTEAKPRSKRPAFVPSR